MKYFVLFIIVAILVFLHALVKDHNFTALTRAGARRLCKIFRKTAHILKNLQRFFKLSSGCMQ